MIANVKTQNGGTLNLRREPSTSSSVLASIKNGTQLEVEKVDDTWSKTTYNGKTGYIMSKYLVQESSTQTFNKADLENIYNSLKTALSMIENLLK